jgi:hypothetical protein
MDIKPVNLSDIAGYLEMQPNEGALYLDLETGEIEMITDDMVRRIESGRSLDVTYDWEREAIALTKRVMASEGERYIALPSEFDIHEWEIMRKFSDRYPDDEIREALSNAIRGRGAFRFFKSTIHRFDIADEWYAYRDEVLMGIAADWCEDHDIPYTRE